MTHTDEQAAQMELVLMRLKGGLADALRGINTQSGRAGLEWARDELGYWVNRINKVLAEQEARDERTYHRARD